MSLSVLIVDDNLDILSNVDLADFYRRGRDVAALLLVSSWFTLLISRMESGRLRLTLCTDFSQKSTRKNLCPVLRVLTM